MEQKQDNLKLAAWFSSLIEAGERFDLVIELEEHQPNGQEEDISVVERYDIFSPENRISKNLAQCVYNFDDWFLVEESLILQKEIDYETWSHKACFYAHEFSSYCRDFSLKLNCGDLFNQSSQLYYELGLKARDDIISWNKKRLEHREEVRKQLNSKDCYTCLSYEEDKIYKATVAYSFPDFSVKIKALVTETNQYMYGEQSRDSSCFLRKIVNE